jgi:MerR family transcriptional regulator, light-induced transcriptional regulator
MKSYTLKEAAKKVKVAPRILKEWEKEFAQYITIPRTKQGARIYNDALLEQFTKIKQWFAEKKTKQEIIQYLQAEQQKQNIGLETTVMEGEVIDIPRPLRHDTYYIAEQVARTMKEEIVGELKKETTEVLEQAMKEMKLYVDEIRENSTSTKQEIYDSLTQYTKTLQQETEEIHEHLENVVTFLQEEKAKREQERKLYEEQIMEREKAFRELVLSFRQTAASTNTKRSNKWWKFW